MRIAKAIAHAGLCSRRDAERWIEQGRVALAESPLTHAPHTTTALTGDWERSYSRATAAFPAGHSPDKYWPPVGRIDQAYGDRHLVCSCPPPEAFEQ